MNQLASERWVYEALSRSLQQGGNISKALIRESQSHEELSGRQLAPAQREFAHQTDEIAFAQEFQSDLAELVQYGWRVEGLSDRLDISDVKRSQIRKTVQDVEDLSERVSAAAQRYRQTFRNVFRADSVSTDSITQEQVTALAPAVRDYATAARSGQRYLELENQLNDQSGTL
jgi:hypothetical protein